jgi:hypothetical protein
VTWPLLELDVGVDDGELRPDELLPDDFEVLELPDELELDLPESEVAWLVPVAVDADEECEAAEAAPGRLMATAPAATRLAAAAETVAARSRLRPRSRSATPGDVPRDGMLCLLMPASLAARFPTAL